MNVDLVRAGFMGCAPGGPVYAFSLQCLENFRQRSQGRTSQQFGIQTMVKELCRLNDVSFSLLKPYFSCYTYTELLSIVQAPFSANLCRVFRIAYDVYLEILNQAHSRSDNDTRALSLDDSLEGTT